MDRDLEFRCEECGSIYALDFHSKDGVCDFCEEQTQQDIEDFFSVECDICGLIYDIDQMYHIEEDEQDVCENCLGK